jgi:hypothetical protein
LATEVSIVPPRLDDSDTIADTTKRIPSATRIHCVNEFIMYVLRIT